MRASPHMGPVEFQNCLRIIWIAVASFVVEFEETPDEHNGH
jgi:hypothetical protein